MLVFADGAARGNPGPGGWGVVIVTPDGKVTELGGGDPHTTNNRMELTAAIEALRHLHSVAGPVLIHSDSAYVVQGMTQWLRRWKSRGWTTTDVRAVLNRDLWQTLDELVTARGTSAPVIWQRVRGHAGIAGNERADEIARAYAAGKLPGLYRGSLREYPKDVLADMHDLQAGAVDLPLGRASRRRKVAYSYLSVVDGVPMRHATWGECERRVRGKSGALFKKAGSPQEEIDILRTWGFSIEDLAG